jgi:hypothetical protein
MKPLTMSHASSDTAAARATVGAGALDARPVMSTRLIATAIGCLVAFVLLTALAGATGRMLGAHLASAGHTAHTRLVDLTVGSFDAQRHSGAHASVDLYFLWPDMTGYSIETRDHFNADTSTAGIVFVSLSEQIMSKDMSGRYAPLYRQLIEDTAQDGPDGLVAYDLTESSGYIGETLFVEQGRAFDPFVARCLGDAMAGSQARPQAVTGTSCQRDILIGEDVAVLYRFPASLLAQWRTLDSTIRSHLEAALLH